MKPEPSNMLSSCSYADHESSLRAKILDAFNGRWFRSAEPDSANKAALELCAVARCLIADAGGATVQLPLPHDTPLARLLSDVLLGSEDKQAAGMARSKRQSLAAAAEAQLVCCLDLLEFYHCTDKECGCVATPATAFCPPQESAEEMWSTKRKV